MIKMESDLTLKCRGCLAEEPEMHNIFNLLTVDLTLANILSETTSIQIEESQEISPYLCIKCTGIVVDFYNFKIQFANSQTYFQNELKKLEDDSFTSFILLKEEDTLQEKINSSEILENNKDNEENLQNKLEVEKDVNIGDEISSLNDTINNENKGQNISESQILNIPDAIIEKSHEVPEVGEFTVRNELVQLIESVVFCCKSCNKEYLLKEDFLNHMTGEHDKAKIDARKFTKKTLVKVPLAQVIEENSDNDFGLDSSNVENEEKLCKLCNIVFSKSEYEYHREEHKTHFCHCGARFLMKSHLVNHEKSVHATERQFVCKYCDKAFKSKLCLTKHVRYHTHPRSAICHICGQVFNDKGVLNTHIKLKHFPTRDYQCSQCGLKFSLKSTLEKHCRRHHTSNREKTFSCSQCNMTYFEKSTLNRHISVKHSDRPVKAKCEYCGKIFTTKGNLYKHLRISHKYDKVLIGRDGSITVQKSGDVMEVSQVNQADNYVLEHCL